MRSWRSFRGRTPTSRHRGTRTAGTVPTWNYVAVHAYGTFHVIEERHSLLEILRRSVLTYESPRPEPWAFDESAHHVETMLKAIVGFRIEITRLEGKWKLSQNQPEQRRRKVCLCSGLKLTKGQGLWPHS